METKIDAFWLNFKSHFLKQKDNSLIYQSWLESVVPSKVEKKGSQFHLTLQMPSDLHKNWLQENLLDAFYLHLNQFYKGVFHVELEVVSTPFLPYQNQSQNLKPAEKFPTNVFFNPKYVFETFVVGKNNSLAYEACLSITRNLQGGLDEFNPLFIYGPSGLGKTHLLNAIGHKFLKTWPKAKVIYVSAERFLNEFITALRKKEMDSFRKKFRKNCDLLLMDDIQILNKGLGIQEEFFHTFNELYNKKSSVVLCCDQSPSCVPKLEERIRTRLEGGLMADISYPNKETRLAILKAKLKERNLFVSPKSLEQIAQTCKKSIREMEGVLNKIKIMAEIYDRSLSIKEIETLLSNFKVELTIEEIQKKVSKVFQISVEDLRSPSRKKQIVTARQTAMYLTRVFLKKSLTDIGMAFGKKDHTTVLNSLKKVEKLKSENKEFKRLIEVLNNEIHNNY